MRKPATTRMRTWTLTSKTGQHRLRTPKAYPSKPNTTICIIQCLLAPGPICLATIWRETTIITLIQPALKRAESRVVEEPPLPMPSWRSWSANSDARSIYQSPIAAMWPIRLVYQRHRLKPGIRIEGKRNQTYIVTKLFCKTKIIPTEPNGNDKINCDWNNYAIRRTSRKNWYLQITNIQVKL